MSSLDLRIEVPAYAQSFQIRVQNDWSIRDVKEEIKRVCQGEPQVDGQRIIFRGRILRDEERVEDIWISPNYARIVHLAVHPSAWKIPPTNPSQSAASATSVPQSSTPSQPTHPTPRSAPTRSQQQISFIPYVPLPFIVQKHNAALHVLTNGCLPEASQDQATSQQSRAFAVSALYAHGLAWPSILDEEYPPHDESNPGVRYERTTLENQPFLRLVSPNATPSPIQQHALRVLSHTFPLLSITTPDPSAYQAPPHNMQMTPTTNLNQYLQQVGLPPMRLAPNQPNNPNDPNNAAVAEIRAIPLRALLMPLLMLTFRTFLLVYFFSPSKRPFFGLLLSVWILYETWGALRIVLGNDRPGQAAAQGRAEQGAGGDQAGNAQRGQAAAPAAGGPSQNNNRGQLDWLYDYLANMGLSNEEAVLDGTYQAPEPSVARKVKSFVGLFLVSLHPAVWDRRRNALRRREGRLRTEANVRESAPPAEGEESNRAQAREQVVARHERRPQWVRSYVDRVLQTEWVDDL